MKLIPVIAGSLLALALSGCELHQVKGEVGGVEVEAKTKDADGDFCPPGQEKKDNC